MPAKMLMASRLVGHSFCQDNSDGLADEDCEWFLAQKPVRCETVEAPNSVGNGWFPKTLTIIFYFLLQQCHHSHNTLENK
jgi:hypothetical protein